MVRVLFVGVGFGGETRGKIGPSIQHTCTYLSRYLRLALEILDGLLATRGLLKLI